jgi:tetratricopeptide (TPR) repeat protein
MNTGLETREELFAVMEQIAEEREAARPIVRELVARGRSIDDIEIPEGWRTAGMVLEIAEHAYSRLETQPTESLSFALLALALATGNETDSYPPPVLVYLEGRAWKEVGYAHRFMCAYDAAVAAQKIAEHILSLDGSLIHEKAACEFARAGTLFKAERYAEARDLNTKTAEVFRLIDDADGELKSVVLDASIDFGNGEFASARLKFERILDSLWKADDRHTLGVAYNNLGHCYRYLGRLSDAISAFKKAKEIFRKLDMPSEVNRTEWGHAAILVEKEPAKALPILRRLRDDYLNRNMPAAAGEIGLTIVDALIATNQLTAARSLTKTILEEFVNAKLDVYAISASAYLRDFDKMNHHWAATAQTGSSARKRAEHQELFVADKDDD